MQLMKRTNTRSQNSHDLVKLELIDGFSRNSNSIFSSTHCYESSSDDDDDDDEEDNTLVYIEDLNSSVDSYCSSDEDYSLNDDDFLINKTNFSIIEKSNIRKSTFMPSKTSSRKSLLSPEVSKLYRNQTLIIDYKCNICNLHLFKGQCVDCELDVNKNKFILLQDNLFSSTMIANDSMITNVKQHRHEIEMNCLLDLYVLQKMLEEDNKRFRFATQF